MKFAMIVLLCCVVAMAAAAPQLITPWTGVVPGVATRTLVAGPTVINGWTGTPGLTAWGGHLINPYII